MAATLLNTPLARGQLPLTRGVLYTVASYKRTTVTTVSLVNTDTVARTLNIYVNALGIIRRVTPMNLSLDPGAMAVLDDAVVLDAGWTLEGDASLAAVVDYVVSGIE